MDGERGAEREEGGVEQGLGGVASGRRVGRRPRPGDSADPGLHTGSAPAHGGSGSLRRAQECG